MRSLALFWGLLAVGFCAPLAEKETAAVETSDNDIRVKRAKEAIMFGNQQNEAKEMSKRVDPSMEDQSGSVFSDEAKDIESPTESLEEEQNDVFDDGENEDGTDGLNESEMEALAEADEANNGDTTALESAENEDEANEAYAKYLKTLQDDDGYMSQYYNLVNSASGSSGWPSNPYEAYGVYGASPFRYRRSLHRRFVGMNFPRANDLKRSHRTKRDLIYPYDALADDYYPPTESYLPYGGYPITGKDEDDDINLGYLLDALDNAKVYNDGYDKVIGYGNPYESPYDAYDTYAALQNPYELEIDEPEVGPWYDVPAKRQAGLSYFPGNKRNPDFYPSFREPWTHYQAFVPEKRSMDEYSDAYRQVMKLAAALRRQNAYYPGDYGYEDYRKK